MHAQSDESANIEYIILRALEKYTCLYAAAPRKCLINNVKYESPIYTRSTHTHTYGFRYYALRAATAG